MNLDPNNGNPTGIGLAISSGSRGVRSTAADLLSNPPKNLAIKTGIQVDQVLFEGKTAVGVKSGEQKCKFTPDILPVGPRDSRDGNAKQPLEIN